MSFFFHEIKRDGITSFRDFMQDWLNGLHCLLTFLCPPGFHLDEAAKLLQWILDLGSKKINRHIEKWSSMTHESHKQRFV